MSSYPPDWLVRPLGKVYPKIVVGYVGNVNNHYCAEDSGVPFYRTLNIRNGHFRSDECLYVTYSFNDKNKKSQIRNNDIVIARVGANLGMVCKVTGLTSLANMANAIIIKTNEVDTADADFYTAFLLSPMGKNQIFSGAAGGAQGVFNTKLTQEILVPVPSLPEQRKIAKILSIWDKAIATTEKLIANSKQQKKALMQQLLTGKKRLMNPETGRVFEGEWVEVFLSSLAEKGKKSFTDGDWIESPYITDTGCRLIQTGNIGVGSFKDKNKKYISSDSFIELGCKEVSQGDLLICRLAEPAGRACVVPDIGEKKMLTSVDVTIVKVDPEKSTPTYLSYYFSLDHTLYLVSALCGGSTRSRVSRTNLGKMKLKIPSLNEQQKIAQVLTTADQEIEHLESKLAHFQQEKKALMQQLLTGKCRVKVDSEIEAV